MEEQKVSLRDHIESAMEQVENGNEPVDQVESLDVAPQDDIAIESSGPDRDESGRFKSKEPKEEVAAAAPAQEETEETEQVEVEAAPALVRPSTWKKEYMPIWDKLEKGEALSKEESRKLAEYSNQRESEYKKGVSTYKAEAERARQLEEAINPFVPELQQQGISPAAWINNLGRAHMMLSKAPYEQKVEMFQRLAQDYGIQFNQMGQAQQLDPYAQQLMAQMQRNEQEVQAIKSRFQQEEEARLNAEIEQFSSDVEKYPHFEALREDMAQLLDLGKAQDIPTAYKLAVRLNDDVWQQEQERLLSQAKHDALKQQQIAKAKSASVSVRSTTPSGKVNDGLDTKDRRAVLAAQMEAFGASRV